ncbi:MAG TPA: Mur ligase domain-containing protein [Candidatus Saccharimonadales bacterium]|nr:Mur ligase domain-containing protein [Candidatus Saccharimonadales bacterium]
MHIYVSGIGGAGVGPLALIAHQAGYEVSGSDKQENSYVRYLTEHGITDIHIGQSYEHIAAVHARRPIDWFVYTSALPMEQPHAPELRFCTEQHIRATKRDEFLSQFLADNNLRMIAVAGTHGKTTTTAMAAWLAKQINLPASWLVPAKLSFGEMGEFHPGSTYFIYEADEFDRNFLAYHPAISMITGIDWDHPDIYPTRQEYNQAFRDFLGSSERAVLWRSDARALGIEVNQRRSILDEHDPQIDAQLHLLGRVNRLDAWLVAQAFAPLSDRPVTELIAQLNRFPGVARRFELIAPHVYSDYAHTPPKIRGALQLAHEVAGDNVVVVYEGLHNTRQHFIAQELATLFDGVKQLYIVPSYLAREDQNLPLLAPSDLIHLMSDQTKAHAAPAALDDSLANTIRTHAAQGDLVLCISAGGGGSLDEWLRKQQW